MDDGQKRGLFHKLSRGIYKRGQLKPRPLRYLCVCLLLLVSAIPLVAQSQWEGRRIARIDVVFEGADKNLAVAEQYRIIARDELGPVYSTVKIRDAIQALYMTDRIVSISVEAVEAG